MNLSADTTLRPMLCISQWWIQLILVFSGLHTSTLFLAYFPFNTPFLVAAEQRSRSFFFKDDAYDISRITFAIKWLAVRLHMATLSPLDLSQFNTRLVRHNFWLLQLMLSGLRSLIWNMSFSPIHTSGQYIRLDDGYFDVQVCASKRLSGWALSLTVLTKFNQIVLVHFDPLAITIPSHIVPTKGWLSRRPGLPIHAKTLQEWWRDDFFLYPLSVSALHTWHKFLNSCSLSTVPLPQPLWLVAT